MSLTKLQTTLIDVYERIIMHGQVFDPDQETLNFLLQAGMTPESETNQRYLQLVRTLRHEDYNVRSSAAKFLCMILFKNHNLQCRIRSLLPITILAANLLVFNLPVIYNTSVLTDLQKDMKDDTNPNRNMVFWHFPVHHMQTESLPSLETLEPAVEEMLLLKLDPLYQFVGSLTAGRKLISRQAKMKPGLLERKLTAHFSSPSLNPVKNPIERSKSFRLKPTLVTEKSGFEDASPNQKDPDFFTLGSRSYRSGSKCSSPKSNRSLDKISRKEVRSVTITTDRSMDNSPIRDNNMPVMNHKTPKFSEVKDFWMPKGYPGQGVSNQRRRAQKAVSKKSFNNSKNASQTDTNTTSPVIKEKISLLDILERNPDYVKEVKMRLSKSRMDLQELSETNSPHNRSMNSINRGRARSLTNPRSDRSISKDFSADYMRAEQSDMSRETLRLLKQDRHDMYRDYDKQVERMRLRPFDKKKFESTCFDPNNFPQKIAMPVVDRKKAFVDFLNAGGKVTEKPVSVPGKIEGIKGNTFHGRKWKNHTSKARLSNFAEKEKYVLYLSPTSAKVQADMKMRNPPKEKPELEVIKDHLATDVAGSQQKYITNIMEVEDLDNKVYGESFKKYLDVLNYEKANYNANDPSKLGEAYDLVNIIYDAKEKAVRRHKAPAKTLTTESECEEEEIDDSKPKRKHKDPRFAINVPRSGLFLRRRRSSMASSNAGSDYNSYHHPHSDHHHGNGKGKKSMHSNMHSNEEIVRLPTGNSASLHAEILTLHPLSRGKSFGSSQVKTE